MWQRLILCLGWTLASLLAAIVAADEPARDDDPEQVAIRALQRVASNVQRNRDGSVRFVRLSKSVVTDEHLSHLPALKKLDYLAVITPTITDRGLQHVSELTNLDTLFVSGTQLTSEGLQSVSNLSKLQRLYLDQTQIDDSGLVVLEKLPELQVLSLADTRLTDAALQHLAACSQLEELTLDGTLLTDAGLPQLVKLKKLKFLSVERTKIAGAGLQRLLELPALESFSVSGTQVTRESLASLAAHPKLKRVVAFDTPVHVGAEGLPSPGSKTKGQGPVYYLNPGGDQRTALARLLAGEAPDSLIERPAKSAAATGPVLPTARERLVQGDEVADFQRHVVPLLGRLGCNGRTCHGSFQGRGGFRLSMFGYDFQADHDALSERLDTDMPVDSLMLRKPTLQEDHEGGKRLQNDSWQYQLLLRWIQAGANDHSVASERPAAKLIQLEVQPAEVVFTQAGDQRTLRVIAHWSDGTSEDVTCLTRFQSNDDAVAAVSDQGLVRCEGPGDSHIVAFYDNGVTPVPVMAPVSDRIGDRYPEVAAPTEVDRLIRHKLSKLGMVPSGLASDEQFFRRVSLDLAGTLPTPEQVERFAADPAADKRARKIEELLQSDAYVEWWTNLLCDLTGSNPQFLGSTDMNRPAAEQWRAWMRRRVRDNVGWDRIAAGILLATSRRPGQGYDDYAAEQSGYQRRNQPDDFAALDNPMHYYWFRGNLTVPSDRALSFGYVFLGVRLQCAQCHKHPFDRWSKEEFEQLTAFFTRIRAGVAPESSAAQRRLKNRLGVPVKLNTAALRRQMYMRVAAEGLPIPWNEIYIEPPGTQPHPAKLLGGAALDLSQFDDPREPLVRWLIAADNPYFARAMVNRVWQHYFGVGIVDPPDDFNQANPPSNKPLLDWLSGEFAARGYDMKWLHRTITSSDAYQRDWRPNDTNRSDRRNFSRAAIRRLPAEVTIDAILQATASDTASKKLATNPQLRKIAQHPISIQSRGIDYSLLVFGKPLRMTNCDCERQMQPSLLQSLYVRNDHELLGWLERPDGWLQQLARELKQPLRSELKPPPAGAAGQTASAEHLDRSQLEPIIDQAYLRTVGRLPAKSERDRAVKHILKTESTIEGLRDLLWVLLNTQEFLTNH